MKWRKWNIILHRDIGYLCFGLTILYAISGVAVNHIQDWNPTYSIERVTRNVNLSKIDTTNSKLVADTVLRQISEQGELKNIYRESAAVLKIFVVNNNITVDIPSQRVAMEKSLKRPLLYQANFLHLNHAKKWWTWFADIYAVCLGFLAISGLFILRGKNGFRGRGKWLVGAGIILPIFFLWLYS